MDWRTQERKSSKERKRPRERWAHWVNHRSKRGGHSKSYQSKSPVRPIDSGEVRVTRCAEIQWDTLTIQRAGILAYIVQPDGELLFCFGDDAEYGELTDPGGGFSKKRDRHPKRAAIREFKEESHQAFPEIEVEELSSCLVIYDQCTMIFLKRMEVDPASIVANFQTKLTVRSELCGLYWINRASLAQLLEGQKILLSDGFRERGMYALVRNLLAKGQLATLPLS